MITVESMVSKLEQGWTKVKAATFAYTSTAFPMLTGTIVTIIGFVPIGFAKSDAGEYTFSLFAVVAMALLISWFVAVLFAPLIGVKILKEKPEHHEHRKSKAVSLFHDLLLFTMRRPKATVFLTIAVFALRTCCLATGSKPILPCFGQTGASGQHDIASRRFHRCNDRSRKKIR